MKSITLNLDESVPYHLTTYNFMRKVDTQSDKSSIRPIGGVESGWGNQSMGNYKYSLVRK